MMREKDMPWVSVKIVCSMYGLTFESFKNRILAGLSPVPTYKVGKIHVIDRSVHDEYFRLRRESGLRELAAKSSHLNTTCS